MTGAITDVAGIRVGQVSHEAGRTGCTVVLAPEGTVGGVDKRGGAVGSRQTDPLDVMHVVQEVHAVVLAGGSAFGLDAATGVVRYLEEKGIGFDVGISRVPIVPTAILFDLGLGEGEVRPDADMGYAACQAAVADRPAEGNAGAGMGATVGKALGPAAAMKSGIGTAAIRLGESLVVGALIAANPFGDVIDPASGAIVAGVRNLGIGGRSFADARNVLRQLADGSEMRFGPNDNTVIGVVATNARLDKRGCTKVAQMAQDGVARAVRPAHTMFDGDTIFALATGEVDSDVNVVGTFAAEVVVAAILRAVRQADGIPGFPSAREVEADR
ncbi:MAG: P1 family peptidase [Anaerolineales bacterium]